MSKLEERYKYVMDVMSAALGESAARIDNIKTELRYLLIDQFIHEGKSPAASVDAKKTASVAGRYNWLLDNLAALSDEADKIYQDAVKPEVKLDESSLVMLANLQATLNDLSNGEYYEQYPAPGVRFKSQVTQVASVTMAEQSPDLTTAPLEPALPSDAEGWVLNHTTWWRK